MTSRKNQRIPLAVGWWAYSIATLPLHRYFFESFACYLLVSFTLPLHGWQSTWRIPWMGGNSLLVEANTVLHTAMAVASALIIDALGGLFFNRLGLKLPAGLQRMAWSSSEIKEPVEIGIRPSPDPLGIVQCVIAIVLSVFLISDMRRSLSDATPVSDLSLLFVPGVTLLALQAASFMGLVKQLMRPIIADANGLVIPRLFRPDVQLAQSNTKLYARPVRPSRYEILVHRPGHISRRFMVDRHSWEQLRLTPMPQGLLAPHSRSNNGNSPTSGRQ